MDTVFYLLVLIYLFFFYVCVCVHASDISPAMQGVDHRQVQKELGDVIVTMHNPIVLSSTSVRVTWAVSLPSALYSTKKDFKTKMEYS